MKPEDQRLTSEQVGSIVKMLGLTTDREFNCSECLQHVSEFAECQMVNKPGDPQAMESQMRFLDLDKKLLPPPRRLERERGLRISTRDMMTPTSLISSLKSFAAV